MNGRVIWFTGLPASGKTTLSLRLQTRLQQLGLPCCTLDGDTMRAILCQKLGYSDEERAEFYGILSRLAAELASQGLIVLVPATAHLRAYRQHARALTPRFLEVWVKTSLEECRKRDPKGLYEIAAKIHGHLPGADLPYEAPLQAELTAEGGKDELALERLVSFLRIEP
jgi:adenylylsulfate kinase